MRKQNELKRIREIGERERVPIIREEEEKILRYAVTGAKPKRILEIGTGTGYSALLLHLWVPQAEITTIESFPRHYKAARKNILATNTEKYIHLLCGNADQLIPDLEGPFDFVYLDGPKGHYLRHLKMIEPILTATATVVADNVYFRGYVEGIVPVPRRMRTIAYRMRNYLRYVLNPSRYETKIYRIGDGIAVSNRKG